MNEIECTSYKEINKGSLKGTFSIYVPKWGIDIHGMQLFHINDKSWINFPSKVYEDAGEKKYFSYMKFRNKEHFEIFSKKVKEAIDKFCLQNYQNLQTF